jgi:AcrR family transcriptional regulator
MHSRNSDRRVHRTRLELLAAFRELVFERDYDKIRITDISDRADVGRSTFYEHFESKDDILEHSLTALLKVLADAIGAADVSQRFQGVIEHFWENRSGARSMLSGTTRQVVTRLLSGLIKERLGLLSGNLSDSRPLIPLDYIASQLAETQLALFGAWLLGNAWCSPAALAQALHVSTNASASALLNKA